MQALSCQSRAQARVVRSCGRSRQRVAVVQAKKTADGPSIAIVGVTGAVGQEFLQVSSPLSSVAAVAAAQPTGAGFSQAP
jgi:aspartate-semialdehyde dehydrogenase